MVGKCAICGKEKQLSYDHIPPKCCGNSGDSYYISFTPEYLGGRTRMAKHKHSQNGIKFLTICNDCNNNLGAKYDKDLGNFRQYVIEAIKGNDNPKYSFDITKAIKGLIGHLLAASKYDPSLPAKAMRDFYFDRNNDLVKKYSLMVCYYPYQNNIFILKNYVSSAIGDIPEAKPYGLLSSLYFYPFAFILCDKQQLPFGNDLLEVFNGPVHLYFKHNDWNGKLPFWPAIVDDNHYLVVSGAGMDSVFK